MVGLFGSERRAAWEVSMLRSELRTRDEQAKREARQSAKDAKKLASGEDGDKGITYRVPKNPTKEDLDSIRKQMRGNIVKTCIDNLENKNLKGLRAMIISEHVGVVNDGFRANLDIEEFFPISELDEILDEYGLLPDRK